MKKLLGKRIKELRTQQKLTQEQLAELLDIEERNLSKIECGVNFVRAETLEKLSAALKTSPKDLFDFNHLQDDKIKKEELVTAILNDKVDIDMLYRIYQAIKK